MHYSHIIVGRYYSDSGTDYAVGRLIEEAEKQSITLRVIKAGITIIPDGQIKDCSVPVIFFDKDINFARALERSGYRLINNAGAIKICNNKIATYEELVESRIKLPETIVAPLVYDVCDGEDKEFIDLIEKQFEYPIVVKENIGSQGRQVYLAKDRSELETLNKKLRHIPHHYQRYYGNDSNNGGDVRVYVIGGKARITVRRTNTSDFRGNVCLGSAVTRLGEDEAEVYEAVAVRVSKKLKLDYCAIDFADCKGMPVLLEVNSNAYFEAVEKTCGVNIAKEIVCLLKK